MCVIGLDSAAPPVTVALIHQCFMHLSDCAASMQKALVACGLHYYILKCLAFYKEAEFDEVIIIINSFPCPFICSRYKKTNLVLYNCRKFVG